jgi:hypothetical protein
LVSHPHPDKSFEVILHCHLECYKGANPMIPSCNAFPE